MTEYSAEQHQAYTNQGQGRGTKHKTHTYIQDPQVSKSRATHAAINHQLGLVLAGVCHSCV